MITLTINETASKLLQKAWQGDVLRGLRATMDEQNELTIGHIRSARMTGQGPFPVSEGRLGVRTNRLRSSLRKAKAVLRGGAIVGSVGSNVKYAAAHEFGVVTKAHWITAKPGKALAFSVQNFFGVNRFTFATRSSIRQANREASTRAFLATGNMQFLKSKGKGVKSRAAFFGQSPLVFRSRVWHPGSNIPARAPITRGIEDRRTAYETAFSNSIINTLRGLGYK